MSENEGCCGHPKTCAYDITKGRCKAREEFENAREASPKRTPAQQRLFEFMGGDEAEIAKAREIARKRRERERKRERSRGGYNLGRTR